MLSQLFNQYDARWSKHALGAAPGELGPYGCHLVCDAMVTWDAFGDMHYTPDRLDEVLNGAGMFHGSDLLDEYALDKVWPKRFSTTHYEGYRRDVISAVLQDNHTDYIRLWLSGTYSPLWKMVIPTHFVLLVSGDGWIADPAGGVMRSILAYGSWAAVKATTHIKARSLAPAVVVVVPKPQPPAPAPQPAPVVELFSVIVGEAVVIAGLSYEAALQRAEDAAALRPGTLYEVRNAKGQTVGTGFRAVLPEPLPVLGLPKSTPAPERVQQPDFWAALQNVLIQLLAPIFKRRPSGKR